MPTDTSVRALACKLKTLDEARLREIAARMDSSDSDISVLLSDTLSNIDTSSSDPSSASTTTTPSATPNKKRAISQLVKSTHLITQLQGALEQKSKDLDHVNKRQSSLETALNTAITRCEGLKKDVADLQSEKAQLLRHYQTREEDLLQAKAKMQEDLAAILVAQEQAEKRVSSFKDNLKAKLEEQLVVSEEAHAALCTLRSEDLDLVQWIRVKVYEQVKAFKADAEEKTLRLEMLSEHADYTADSLKKAHNQLEHNRATWEDEMDQMRTTLNRYEKNNDYLTKELDDLSRKHDKVKGKELTYDQVQEKAGTFEKQAHKLESECEMLRQKVDFLMQERNEYKAESVTDRYGMQNASTELKFLMRENDYLVSRMKELEAEKNRYEEKCKDLKQAQQEAWDKLHQERESLSNQYETKLCKETDRLRTENARDLEVISEQCREVGDREVRSLREARDAAISESERYRRKAKDLKEEKNQLAQEYKNLQDCSQTTLAELRGTLKTREFELDRARMAAEESRANQLELKTELEIATKKLDILRNDFYETQATFQAKNAELHTQIENYKERIQIYNALEVETDDLICKVATTVADSEAEEASKSLAALPTAPTRRVQQAIHLARQAAHLQGQLIEMKEELEKKTKTEVETQAELNKLRTTVQHTGQPYNFFINSIHEKDAEILNLHKTLTELQTKYNALESENDLLQQDLQKLLQHKQEVGKLREMLLQLKLSGNLLPKDIDLATNTTLHPKALVPSEEYVDCGETPLAAGHASRPVHLGLTRVHQYPEVEECPLVFAGCHRTFQASQAPGKVVMHAPGEEGITFHGGHAVASGMPSVMHTKEDCKPLMFTGYVERPLVFFGGQ